MTAVPRPQTRFPPWARAAGQAVATVVAWVYLLSFPRVLPMSSLDLSWSAVVARAGAEHWAFGRQIMLNYGPWAHFGIGFYYAPLFTADYLFQLASKAVLVALIFRVGRALPLAVRWPFFAANLVTGMLEWEYTMTLAAIYAGWLTSEDRTRGGRLIGAAGVALAAAAALMKTFYLVFGQGVFVCVLARHLLRGRGQRTSWLEGLWPLAFFEVGFCVSWLLAGQTLGDLPIYLRGSLALIDGQSRAMGYDPSPGSFCAAAALVFWTGGLGALWFWRGPRTARLAGLPLAALFAGGLFMAWKQGITRADKDHLSGYFCFTSVFITTLPLFFDRHALAPVWHRASIVGVWLLAAAGTVAVRPSHLTLLADETMYLPTENLRILFAPGEERAELDARVAALRAANVMPRTKAVVGRARIDCFGTMQGLLLLNDLNYAPVPTLQGYLAYPPYLSGLDAACYEPDRAPEFVLFKISPIDYRWDALDGARQLREILWNYEPVLVERHLLLLRRKPPAACSSPQPVLQQQGEVALDATLPLPADGADWCELEVHRTLLGRLIGFVYHEPALMMEVTTSDGTSRRSILPPVMAQGGFLLRQAPRSSEDPAQPFSGQSDRNPVQSIRLGGNDLLRASIGDKVTYRFYHLDPPRPATN